MSLDAYLKAQGFDLQYSDKEIRFEKKRKINVTSIVIGVIGIFIMMGGCLFSNFLVRGSRLDCAGSDAIQFSWSSSNYYFRLDTQDDGQEVRLVFSQ